MYIYIDYIEWIYICMNFYEYICQTYRGKTKNNGNLLSLPTERTVGSMGRHLVGYKSKTQNKQLTETYSNQK